jgi:drug/metabolite transporter (DMT)-like permease
MIVNIAILIVLALAWASDNVLIARVDQALPPLTSTAAITAAGALFLLIGVRFVLRRPLLPTLRAQPVAVLIMAATAIALPQLSIVAAEDTISPALASVVGTTVPLLTYIAATCILRTVPWRLSGMLGVVVAIGGMIVFADPTEILSNEAELYGIAVMVSGGVVFVCNGLYAARKAADLDQYALTVWIIGFATLGLAVAALTIEGVPTKMPGRSEFLTIAASGIVGMGFAYLLYFLLIARADATFTSLYAFLVPPFGVLCSAIFADGTLTSRHVAGVAIVLFGLWLVLRPGPEHARPGIGSSTDSRL